MSRASANDINKWRLKSLNLLFLALAPPEGSSSNLSALFSNLYPLLPNLKVSPNLWSCPSPFCLPVLSEAGHLLYSHPTRTDLALQSSEHLDGVPGHPRAPRWGTMCSKSPSLGYHGPLKPPEGTPRPLMCQHKILAPLILARGSRTAERLSDNCPTKLFQDTTGREKGRFKDINLNLQKGY